MHRPVHLNTRVYTHIYITHTHLKKTTPIKTQLSLEPRWRSPLWFPNAQKNQSGWLKTTGHWRRWQALLSLASAARSGKWRASWLIRYGGAACRSVKPEDSSCLSFPVLGWTSSFRFLLPWRWHLSQQDTDDRIGEYTVWIGGVWRVETGGRWRVLTSGLIKCSGNTLSFMNSS